MNKNLHLFIFADAMGWELVQHYGILKSVAPLQNKCETLFGYSATCDPTILTGATPQEHGHFSFFVKTDPKDSPFSGFKYLQWLPDRIAGYHKIRNRLSKYVAKKRGYTGYFQLYSVPFKNLPWLDYTEKKDIYEPGGILGGQPTFFEKWKQSGKKWYRSNWRNGDAKNYDEVETLLRDGKTELIYLFTAGLDAVMHRYGPWSKQAKESFHLFEQKIEALMLLAERNYSEVKIALFSDHGMTEVTETSKLRLHCEHLPLKYGKDYVAVWDSTMARFWFNNQNAKDLILPLLEKSTEGHILSKETLQQWHCNFSDNKYGELFYLLNPGVLFVPSFLNLSKVPGMHGYSPDHKDSAASWLSNFTPKIPVKELKDIHPVLSHAALEDND